MAALISPTGAALHGRSSRGASPHTAAPSLTPADLRLPARFTAYRPGQDRIALDLAASAHRFSLLSAPTGSGKTLIYATVARLLDARTLILVGTKHLQQQILGEFAAAGAVEIKGRANYPCPAFGDCDGPNRAESVCPFTGGLDPACAYARAVKTAAGAELVVANYAYWMALARYDRDDILGAFDLLVCDEAHSTEDWLSDFCTLSITRGDARELIGATCPLPRADAPIDDWRAWAGEARTLLAGRMRAADGGGERRAKIRRLFHDLGDFAQSSAETGWAVDESRIKGVTIAPIRPAEFAERYVFRGVPRVVLTSATLMAATAARLGIDLDGDDPAESGEYLEVTTAFDPRRRPLIYVPTVRVDNKIDEGGMRMLVRRIDSVIETRLDRKGVIHAKSYARSRELLARSRFAEHMLVHSTYDARHVIDRFKRADPPAILVSPAVEEGVDFPHEQVRWQIVVKIPFDPPSALTKARKKVDPDYVYYTTAQSLIQMVGRGVRAETDWCETLIFDINFGWFRNRATFPRWFRAAWRQAADIPPPMTPTESGGSL